MKLIEVNFRKIYFVLLNTVCFIVYFFRLFILNTGKSSIIFGGQYLSYNINALPIFEIIIFILLMNLLVLLLPAKKEIILNQGTKKYNGWLYWFYFQNIFQIMFYLSSGFSMGRNISTIENMIYQFIIIVSPDLLLFFLLFDRINNDKKIWDLLIFYLLPFLVKGSKSGIIFFVIYYFAIKLFLNKKINLKRYVLLAAAIVISYPVIYSISYYFRNSMDISITEQIVNNTRHMMKNSNSYIWTALDYFTRRANATDVLFLKPLLNDKTLFSGEILLFYLLKGIVGSSVASKFISGYEIGLGTAFARKLGFYSAGGIETTLFGDIFFSDYDITSLLVIATTLIVLFIVIRYHKNYVFGAYLLVQIILVIITGTIQNFTYSIRTYLIYCVVNFIVGKIHIKIGSENKIKFSWGKRVN